MSEEAKPKMQPKSKYKQHNIWLQFVAAHNAAVRNQQRPPAKPEAKP